MPGRARSLALGRRSGEMPGGRELGAVSRALLFMKAALRNPVEVSSYVVERSHAQHDYEPSYSPVPDWELRLHDWLGAVFPCPQHRLFDECWAEIALDLDRRGLRFGRASYGSFSDAEEALARAVWCVVMHRCPAVVVETGVARGVTSRLVLEAMDHNDRGHLWSVDLPYLFDPALHAQIAAAVPLSRRSRWTYIEGSSRRRLPSVLRSCGGVDVFIHDSLHTARNTRFEMEHVLDALTVGGVMIVDDIVTHQAFASFTHDHRELDALVCPHSDRTGSYFGLLRKCE